MCEIMPPHFVHRSSIALVAAHHLDAAESARAALLLR